MGPIPTRKCYNFYVFWSKKLTNLGYESGEQVGAFDEKKTSKKSCAGVPLMALPWWSQWLHRHEVSTMNNNVRQPSIPSVVTLTLNNDHDINNDSSWFLQLLQLILTKAYCVENHDSKWYQQWLFVVSTVTPCSDRSDSQQCQHWLCGVNETAELKSLEL